MKLKIKTLVLEVINYDIKKSKQNRYELRANNGRKSCNDHYL
jgi:hypothetical protein